MGFIMTNKGEISLGKILFILCSLPKTIFFNLRSFDLPTALKLPVFVGVGCKVMETHKGIIKFEKPFRTFELRFGWKTRAVIPIGTSTIKLHAGEMRVGRHVGFAEGCVFDLNGGRLRIGDDFWGNRNFFLSCTHEITIGDDSMAGWNTCLFDADGHTVFDHGVERVSEKFIRIGNHVWVGAHVHILKRVNIPDGSIVAYGSLVTRQFEQPNILIGGTPAKQLRDEVEWVH